jgi:hypothetical protein
LARFALTVGAEGGFGYVRVEPAPESGLLPHVAFSGAQLGL